MKFANPELRENPGTLRKDMWIGINRVPDGTAQILFQKREAKIEVIA